jgi:hypothetical protein
MGLATPRIARARGMRIDGPLPENEIESIANDEHVDVAILYEDWFSGSIPPAWKKIGTEKIADNHVCAKDTITFYATRSSDTAMIAANLKAFGDRLPQNVSQTLAP